MYLCVVLAGTPLHEILSAPVRASARRGELFLRRFRVVAQGLDFAEGVTARRAVAAAWGANQQPYRRQLLVHAPDNHEHGFLAGQRSAVWIRGIEAIKKPVGNDPPLSRALNDLKYHTLAPCEFNVAR